MAIRPYNTKCEYCKGEYLKTDSRRRFCGRRCANLGNGSADRIAQIKFWIGKKRNFTEEHRKKISVGLKGRISPMLGRHHSELTKNKMANSMCEIMNVTEMKERQIISHAGERAYNWKGEEVSYRNLHRWVHRWRGKPDKCEHCGRAGLHGKEIHWANKSGEYKRNLNDWLRLCANCHKQYDKAVV